MMLMMLASTLSNAPNHLEELQTSGALGFGGWERRLSDPLLQLPLNINNIFPGPYRHLVQTLNLLRP